MKYKNLFIEVKTEFSENSKCRYYLSYVWDNKKPSLGIIMFNPSTANENHTDRTHSRLINTFSGKYGGIEVINLISEISSNPKCLSKIKKIDVLNYINKLNSNEILLAWGALPKLLEKAKRNQINETIEEIINNLKNKGKILYQLQENKLAHPLIRRKIELYNFDSNKLIKF